MYIVGDIGGTKTLLATVDLETKSLVINSIKTYSSNDYVSFELILEDYLSNYNHNSNNAQENISGICLAVAAALSNNKSIITNLDWNIDGNKLKQDFYTEQAKLYNDLEAMAAAVSNINCSIDQANLDILEIKSVDESKLLTNNRQAKAVIAPGTGLGVAYSILHNGEYIALPSQGGHLTFAPQNKLQFELLEYLQKIYGAQIGLELVCSGVGIPNLFKFFKDCKQMQVSDKVELSLDEQLNQNCVPVIINNAQNNSCEVCIKTVEMFLDIFAQAIQAMALSIYATDGIYLAGGIAIALKQYLMQEDFLSKIVCNSTMHSVLEKFPIYLCQNKYIALIGASKLLNIK